MDKERYEQASTAVADRLEQLFGVESWDRPRLTDAEILHAAAEVLEPLDMRIVGAQIAEDRSSIKLAFAESVAEITLNITKEAEDGQNGKAPL